MDSDDDILSQIAIGLENEYFELNDSMENTILSQALDGMDREKFGLADIGLTHNVDTYGLLQGEMSFDLGSGVKPQTSVLPQVENSVDDTTFVRFSTPVTDDDINNLIDSKKNKNTAKNTKWGFNIFESWRKSRIKDNIPELHVMDKPTMAHWLSRFVLEVRSQKGEEYTGKTLYSVLCALLRHIRDCGVHDINFLDDKDSEFAVFIKTVDSKLKDLLQRGIGTQTRQADPLSAEDEETLWEKGVFGANDAQTLQYTMFYYNCKLFGLRGRDEHRNMVCDQFEVGEDASGRFVRFTGRNCKTFQGGIGQRSLANKDIKNICPEGPRCLATYYQMYLDAMGNEGCFYRRALTQTTSAKGEYKHRYSQQPIGVNKLDKFMGEIAKLGDIRGNFTNHSGKRTCATALYNAGIDEQDIMERTGHRSTHGVRKYKRANDSTRLRVSNVLNPVDVDMNSAIKSDKTVEKYTEKNIVRKVLPCQARTIRNDPNF